MQQEVVIVGGGMVGLSLALMLAKANIAVKLLEAINQKFKRIPDINQHATSLVADMVLSGMVHIRSQRHNGFLHRPQMQALHRWRLQHNPYLTPANKWLQPISEQDLTTAKAASTAQAQPDS